MSRSRSAFSRHYKKILIAGPDPRRLIERCLMEHIYIKNIKSISDTELSMEVSRRDFSRMKTLAGSRYEIKTIKEGGYIYKIGLLKEKKALLAGCVIFAAFFIYQNMFISEIEVAGYESISEQALRETMKEAGLYEGCRKNIDIDKVKLSMFEEHDKISWIGIKYKGNLAQVTIAETDVLYDKNKVDVSSPCNIIADKSGYINSVDPEEGSRAVDDGEYVKEGDVLISGEIPLQKTTYEEDEDTEQISYVHAAGYVDAKVPVRINFYCDSKIKKKEKTGRKRITLSVNNSEIMRGKVPFETSVVKRLCIVDLTRPVKLKVQVNLCDEVVIKEETLTVKQAKKQALNKINEFVKEKLPYNTQILNKSLNFTTEKNIMNIGVTLETLQQIGKEEEIIVDKSNRKTEKDDNQ